MMTTLPRLTLYDLEGQPKHWNLNVAKSRQLLNAKDIAFSTRFVKYTNMADILRPAGFEGDASQTYPQCSHTVPTLELQNEDGKSEFIVDSENIARRIEEVFPGRGLVVDQSAAIYKETDAAITATLGALRPILLHAVLNGHLVDPKDKEYFEDTRRKRQPPFNFDDVPNQIEPAWEAGGPKIAKLGSLLLAKPGPFLDGQTATYGDIRITSLMVHFYQTSNEQFERFLSYDEQGGLAKLWNATTAWRKEYQ